MIQYHTKGRLQQNGNILQLFYFKTVSIFLDNFLKISQIIALMTLLRVLILLALPATVKKMPTLYLMKQDFKRLRFR